MTQHTAREELRRAALEYHEFPTPGKIEVNATKQLINQRDLATNVSTTVNAGKTLHQGIEVAGLEGAAMLAKQVKNVVRRGGHG
mgnify:CR=1 FL=1